MNDFIMEISGAATPEFCEMLIEKYENDPRKEPAQIGPEGSVDKTIRSSVNLEMNYHSDWRPIVDELRAMIYTRLQTYLDEIHTPLTKSMFVGGYDSSYSLLKYVPGTIGYSWHNDFLFDDFSDRGGCRTVTWLFYINDNYKGGETEFKFGRKIKPEQGKLVFFPSTWCMVHRGRPVKEGEKYLGVGWLYSTWNKCAK